MVRTTIKSKELTSTRRDARRDKESQIDGLLSDAAYVAKVSAIASAHSNEDEVKKQPPPSVGGKAAPAVGDRSGEVGEEGSETHFLSKKQRRQQKKNDMEGEEDAVEGARGKATVSTEKERRLPNASPSRSEPRSTSDIIIVRNPEAPAVAAAAASGNDAELSSLPLPNSEVAEDCMTTKSEKGSSSNDENDDEDVDFLSCRSCVTSNTQRSTACSATCTTANTSCANSLVSSPTSSRTPGSILSPREQMLRDCAAFPWYAEAIAELDRPLLDLTKPTPPASVPSSPTAAAAAVDEPVKAVLDNVSRREAYARYCLAKGGAGYKAGHTDNPYVLPEPEWWRGEREVRLAALNARLAKAKRLLKTGTTAHAPSGPSAKTREQQKSKEWKLTTSNRFGNLMKI